MSVKRLKKPASWKAKVHPGFLEVAGVYKQCVKAFATLGPNPPSELVSKIDARFRQEMDGVRKRYAQDESFAAPSAFDMIYMASLSGPSWPPTQRDEAIGLLEDIYWSRFREPLWIAAQKADSGDLKALRKVTRVMEDYQRLRFGKGPIKRAKGHPDHSRILEMGLDRGLNELTSEELADFFDFFCPCGKTHDADSLKKHRLRVRNSIKQAETWLYQQRAKIPARERLAVYGKDGVLAARGVRSQDGTRQIVIGVRQRSQREAYFLPDVRMSEDGSLIIREGSPFTRRSALRELPAAFNVGTTKDLFTMFFPGR